MRNAGNSGATQRVLGFFYNEVSMYIITDIERLTNEIRPDPITNLGGCTVPLAMMLFTVLDLFGFLCRDDNNPRKSDTLGNFRYILSSKANFFQKEYEDNCEKIVKLFRHGIMHQFFCKASGISKAGLNSPLVFQSEGLYVLNVDILSKDVQKVLYAIKQTIEGNKDPDLAERINSRLDLLAREDYETLMSL